MKYPQKLTALCCSSVSAIPSQVPEIGHLSQFLSQVEGWIFIFRFLQRCASWVFWGLNHYWGIWSVSAVRQPQHRHKCGICILCIHRFAYLFSSGQYVRMLFKIPLRLHHKSVIARRPDSVHLRCSLVFVSPLLERYGMTWKSAYPLLRILADGQ